MCCDYYFDYPCTTTGVERVFEIKSGGKVILGNVIIEQATCDDIFYIQQSSLSINNVLRHNETSGEYLFDGWQGIIEITNDLNMKDFVFSKDVFSLWITDITISSGSSSRFIMMNIDTTEVFAMQGECNFAFHEVGLYDCIISDKFYATSIYDAELRIDTLNISRNTLSNHLFEMDDIS